MLTLSQRDVALMRHNRTISQSGRHAANVGHDIIIEDLNKFDKTVIAQSHDVSGTFVESVSLLATLMKRDLNQLQDDLEIKRRRHFHPSYETDIERCSTAFKATGMMRLTTLPLALKDHLAPSGKSIPELPTKYLNVKQAMEASLPKATQTVCCVLQERWLGVAASEAWRSSLIVIGKDVGVKAYLHEGKNAALVTSFAEVDSSLAPAERSALVSCEPSPRDESAIGSQAVWGESATAQPMCNAATVAMQVDATTTTAQGASAHLDGVQDARGVGEQVAEVAEPSEMLVDIAEQSEMVVDDSASQHMRTGLEAITEWQQGDSTWRRRLMSPMPSVLRNYVQSVFTTGHAYAGKALDQEVYGKDYGVVWEHDVLPELNVFQTEDLVEHYIENEHALMLGGLKVGLKPEQAIQIACLRWKEKQAGNHEAKRLAASRCLDEYKELSKTKLVAAVEAGEHAGRYAEVSEHGLKARNITGEELKARILSGEEKNPVTDYVCVEGMLAVDCWSSKTSKLLYPTGSMFTTVLTSGSTVVDTHDKEGPVRSVNGVGKRIELVLVQTFQIKTVGALATLMDENLEQFQEKIRSEKLLGARINLKTLRKRAQDYLNAGMPDATEENEEPDPDYQEQIEHCRVTDEEPTIVTLHDTQLEPASTTELVPTRDESDDDVP